MSYRYRYYYLNKDSVQSSLKSTIENLETLFSQEAEQIVASDLIEVEGLNTISCPPHFTQMVQAIKILRELQQRVDCDSFISLQKREE